MSIVAEWDDGYGIVLEGVDRSLGMFGESTKKAIFFYLGKAGVLREEIPRMQTSS